MQLFTSEEQKKSQGYNFGASLLNLCIDEDEYVYTVSSPNVGTNFIKRLNYKASDVLNRNGYVPNDGDVVNKIFSKTSKEYIISFFIIFIAFCSSINCFHEVNLNLHKAVFTLHWTCTASRLTTHTTAKET